MKGYSIEIANMVSSAAFAPSKMRSPTDFLILFLGYFIEIPPYQSEYSVTLREMVFVIQTRINPSTVCSRLIAVE